jgi:small conductance mechanosensitive channel
MLDVDKLNEYLELAEKSVVTYLPKVALAIIVLLIGIRIINKMVRMATKAMEKREMGTDIAPFLASVVGIMLKLGLFFVVAGTLGFDTAGLVAVVAAASFAVGLALQGSLGNFAAGILVLVFKPYRRGDWIQVDDFFGRVEEIQIFSTILETPGAKTLIVPNGQVVENVVTNYSQRGKVRLELTILMAYEESFPNIRRVILEAVNKSTYVLDEPAPMVGIESYDTHNIVVAVRPYVSPEDYWDATFEINELIKGALSTANIRMAYSEGVELGKIGE